jgi:hypothetical protein
MREQEAAKQIQTNTCALIIILLVLSLVACFSLGQLPLGKNRVLAELYPTKGTVTSSTATTTNIPTTATSQVAMYHDLFGFTPVVGANYSFSPPISVYCAILIALENGSWTTPDLKNMTVHISLNYCIFYTNVTALYYIAAKENLTLLGHPNPDLNSTQQGFESLYQVNTPAVSYQPAIFNGVSLRYIWTVTVDEDSGSCIPPPGCYFVDAATGQLIPTGPLI